jgi:hypothetical protein
MIVPAAEAEITKGSLYVGAAGAVVVAKVGSFTHGKQLKPGQVTLPEDAGWGSRQSVGAREPPLPPAGSEGADPQPGSGFGRKLRRRRRVVNALGYTRGP